MLQRTMLLIALTAFTSGCWSVATEAVIDTTAVGVASSERYHELASKVVAGENAGGVAGITSADLAATPPRVKTLTQKLLNALHANRFSWHSIQFQLDEGPDPKHLNLKPIQLPGDENDELLEDK